MTRLLPLAAAIVLGNVLLALTWAPHLSTSGDNAEYINLSQHLGDYASTKFPPLYPAVLWLVGPDLTAMKLVAGASYVALGAVVTAYAGILAGVLTLTMPALLLMSSQVMADVPFALLVTVGVLLCASRERRPSRSWIAYSGDPPGFGPAVYQTAQAWWWTGFAILLLSCYVKTAGVAIVLGVLLLQGRKLRPWAVATLVLAPWFAWTWYHGGNTYIGKSLLANGYYPERGFVAPIALLERVWSNVNTYIYHMPMILALFIVGERRLLLLPFIPYMGLTLIWPWAADRMLVPLVPICAIALSLGVKDAVSKPWARHTFYAAFIALAVLALGRVVLAHQALPDELSPEWQRYRDAGVWLRDNTPKESIVCARKPGWLGWHAQRKGVGFLFVGRDSLWQDLLDKRVDYVVVDQLGYAATPRHLIPALQAHGDELRLRWSSGGTHILEMWHDGTQAEDSPR
uniref:Uncharacterized protein n=1 Tax=viral metagenome TaxID=1070528 RepID=A0A6M3XT61_9ZZZZ